MFDQLTFSIIDSPRDAVEIKWQVIAHNRRGVHSCDLGMRSAGNIGQTMTPAIVHMTLYSHLGHMSGSSQNRYYQRTCLSINLTNAR